MLFLSHSGADSAAAKELARRLREAGLEVWLDLDHLQPGDAWMAALEEALQRASAFAVYVGSSGIQRWVDREVRVALERSTADPAFRIIPILGAGAADPSALPFFLRQHHALDFRQEISPAELKRLIGAILTRPTEAVSLLPPGTPPFRGLEYFDIEHAHLFFGRDADTRELLEKLRADRFLAVVGASGSGKSSLVRAGLIPMLHRGRFQDGGSWPASWRIAICRPGSRPLRSLASALPDLDPLMLPADRIRTISECARQLEQDPGGLDACIAALVPQGSHTLLLVDQFEEIFTLTSAPEERRHFIDTLLGITGSVGDRPVHVLITLRADFYSRCWEHTELPARIAQNQHAARPLLRAQLREVIEKPLALAGASSESGLVDRILNEAGDEPGSLALVEHALLQLWDRRQGTVLTHATYEEMGGVSGALAHHADEVFARLREDQRQIARKIFLRLTQPGEGTEDTRRRAGRDEIVALGSQEEVAEQVLTYLAAADARLVVTRREGESNVVEVAHEALIREWPRLREWIDANRAAIRIERRLIAAATDWVRAAKDPDALLRGAQLVETQEWAQQHWNDLRPQEQEFLEASIETRDQAIREAEERRQRELEMARRLAEEAAARADAEWQSAQVATRAAQRSRQFSWLLAGLAVVAIIAAGVAWKARGEAERRASEAASRELAAASEARFTRDPSEALMLAIRAVNRAATFEAVTALQRSLAVPTARAVWEYTGRITDAAVSSDGRRAITSLGGTVLLWDLDGAQPPGTMPYEGRVLAAAFSPDGRRAITAGADGAMLRWDLERGQLLDTLRRHVGGFSAAAFSPEGRRALTASDGTVLLWDLEGAQPPDTMPYEGHVLAVGFSPDGPRAITYPASGREVLRWDLEKGELLDSVTLGREGHVLAATFSPDGPRAITRRSYDLGDGTLIVWDLQEAQPLDTLPHPGEVSAAAFSADGRLVITAGHDPRSRLSYGEGGVDGKARLWDLHGNRARSRLPGGGPRPPLAVGFSADGPRVITVDETGPLLWDLDKLQLLHTLRQHGGFPTAAAFSPDGQCAITGAEFGDPTVSDLETGQPVHILQQWGFVHTAAVSCEGQRALIAAVGTGAVLVWDLETDQVADTVRLEEAVLAVSVSADGKRAIIGTENGSVLVWNLESNRATDTLRGHAGGVSAAAFSPNGRRLITADADGAAFLWDLERGQPQSALPRHTGEVRVGFSTDGRRVIIAGGDGTARLFHTNVEDMLMAARARIPITLAPAVRDTLFGKEGGRRAATARQ